MRGDWEIKRAGLDWPGKDEDVETIGSRGGWREADLVVAIIKVNTKPSSVVFRESVRKNVMGKK